MAALPRETTIFPLKEPIWKRGNEEILDIPVHTQMHMIRAQGPRMVVNNS